jgi:hypothetical protein
MVYFCWGNTQCCTNANDSDDEEDKKSTQQQQPETRNLLVPPQDQGAVAPEDCLVMISFNDATAGPDAEKLAKFLTSMGLPTFCTNLYCPNNPGDWRKFTKVGAMKCRYYIPLLTYGWQKSPECQYETDIAENRRAMGGVTIIPVWYKSFDAKYDEEKGHYYKTGPWKSIQGVFKTDKEWMNTVLNLLPAPVTLNPPVLRGVLLPNDPTPVTPSTNAGPVDFCLILRPPTSPIYYLSGAAKHTFALEEIYKRVKSQIPENADAIIADGNHARNMKKLQNLSRPVQLLVLCAEGLSPIHTLEDDVKGDSIFCDADVITLLKTLKPKVLVLMLKYGSASAAKDLAKDAKNSVIIPIKYDAFSDSESFRPLFNRVLIPAIKDFLNDNRPVQKFYENLKQKFLHNKHVLSPFHVFHDAIGDLNATILSSKGGGPVSSGAVEKMYGISQELSWNDDNNTPANLMLRNAKLRKQLVLRLDDIPIIKHFSEMLEGDMSMTAFHFKPRPGEGKEVYQRARAIPLYVCYILAQNREINIFDGIFRVASKDDVKKVESALKEKTDGRALLWIDVVSEGLFANETYFATWIENLPDTVELTFLLTSAIEFVPNFDRIKSQMRRCEIEFQEDPELTISASSLSGLSTSENQVQIMVTLRGIELQALSGPSSKKKGLLDDIIVRELLGEEVEKEEERRTKDSRFDIKVYPDDDNHRCINVRVGLSNIKQLISACNLILFQKGQDNMKSALVEKGLVSEDSLVEIDVKHAADILNRGALQLETLNDEQQKIMESWQSKPYRSMKIDGAAGTGKVSLFSDKSFL